VLVRDLQGIQGGVAELLVLVALAHARPDGMNDVPGPELAAGRDHGAAHERAADPVALLLDARPALTADGAGHTAPQDKLRVGGVDNRVRVHLRDVTLDQFEGPTCDLHVHVSILA